MQGILNCSSPNQQCLCYIRNLEGLHQHLSDSLACKYTDAKAAAHTMPVAEAQVLLNNLKFKIIPSHLQSQNIHSFTVPWINGGINPCNSQHKLYLDSFCSQVYKNIKEMIDSALQNRSKVYRDNGLYKEILQHASFCKSKCENFYGQQHNLSQIQNYIQANKRKPLVIYGASGTGKTSIMAMSAILIKTWLHPCHVVLRFLGTSLQSSTLREVLVSVSHQIHSLLNYPSPNYHQMDVRDVVQHFNKIITSGDTLPNDISLIIFLDAVDQLSENDGAHSLNWLPKSLAHNVHIVISMLPELHGCLSTLKLVLPDKECYIELPLMQTETGMFMLESWLAKSRRIITDTQKEAVIQAFVKCPRPLFMRLLLYQALQWKSHTSLSSIAASLPSSVNEAILSFFQSVEEHHGTTVVHHSLGYISAAKNGLTELELEDVLSLDDRVLDSVYQYWDPPILGILRLPPLILKRIKYEITDFMVERMADGKAVLAWYHRQFFETASQRYLLPSDKYERHALLATYFEGKWSNGKYNPVFLSHRQLMIENADRQIASQPLKFSESVHNMRKLSELPFHLVGSLNCKQFKLLVSFNFHWLLAKLIALPFSNLIYDFSQALSVFQNDEELQILSECIALSANNLKSDPYSLAGQLLGRLLMLCSKYEHVYSLLQQARASTAESDFCTILPSVSCLISPGGPLKTTLSGHNFRLDNVIVFNISSHVLAVSLSKKSKTSAIINVWDISSLDCVDILYSITIESHFSSCGPYVTARGGIVAGAFGHKVVILNSKTGEELQTFAISEQTEGVELSCDEKIIYVLTTAGKVVQGNITDGSFSFLPVNLSFEGVSHICLCSDDFLILSSKLGYVGVFSLQLKTILHVLSTHGKGITCICVHPFSKGYVCLTGSEDCTVTAVDVVNGCIISKLKGHTKKITCVSVIMSDALTAISGSMDKSVRIWNIISGSLLHICVGHTDTIWCLATLQPNVVVSGSKDDYLKVWDIKTGSCMLTLEGHSSWVSCVTAGGKDVILSGSNDKTVKVWKLHPPKFQQLERHLTQPNCIVATKNGLVVSGSERDIKVWNVSHSICIHTWHHPASCLIAVGCSRLISGGNNGLVTIWDLFYFSKICDMQGHTASVTCLEVFPEKELLMSSSNDASVRVWSLVTNKTIQIFEESTNPIKCLCVSCSGNILVSGSYSGNIYVWDLNSFECKHTLSGHAKVVGCIKVSRDTSMVISGSDDCTLRIWNIKDGNCMHTISFTDSVKVIALTQNQLYIVAGIHCSTNNLQVFNINTGRRHKNLYGHAHAVMCMLLIFSDKFLVTGSRDGTVRVWSIPSAQQCACFDLQSQVKYLVLLSEISYLASIAATTKSGPVAFLNVNMPKTCHFSVN